MLITPPNTIKNGCGATMTMGLQEFINTHYGGNKAAFARALNVPSQRVNEWCDAVYISQNWALYIVCHRHFAYPRKPDFACEIY